MAEVNFIEFYQTTDEAFSERTSPQIQNYEVRGIQLLPNNPYPYIQKTNVNGGIELEDWTASIVSCDDKPVIIQGGKNIILYSEQIDNAVWNKNFTTIGIDATPVGSYFGDKLIATTDSGAHTINQLVTKTEGTQSYTFSAYVKADEYNNVRLQIQDFLGSVFFFHFNLDTQSFTNILAVGGITNTSQGYTDEGDGWYRIYASFDITDTNINIDIQVINNANSPSFTGDGVSGIYVRGIQLNEGGLGGYVETTNTSVEVVGSETLGTDITDYFSVDDTFNDINGYPQFIWSLTNIPFDFGNKMVYLKVDQTLGETFYSNLFQFTSNNSERTTRIDYRDALTDIMQSIQIKMWFWQELKEQDVKTYYETSTRNTVTNVIKSQKYEKWLTDVMAISLFMKITDVFEKKYVYVDLIRRFLFKNLETKETEGRQNFSNNKIYLSNNSSDVYNPTFVEPTIETTPTITLNSVVSNGLSAIYYFSYLDFAPQYLIFSYSSDQVTWTKLNQGITSPQSVSFSETGTWYFRVEHPEAISNVIQLSLNSPVVANNDSVQVSKGGVVDISALFNDTLVGATTITAVSTPTNGTATIIESGTKIRYTHDDSSTSFDSVNYTISNGITSDTATISIVITVFGTTTSFMTNIDGGLKRTIACPLVLDVTRYFIGFEFYPSIGDYVYTNESGTTPLVGGSMWYPVPGGRAVRIDNNGLVIDAGFC